MNDTNRMLKTLARRPEIKTPIATDMFVPNHSGDLSAGKVLTTPTHDNDPVNKAYVDSLTPDLSGVVPYTGATTDVNLGAHDLTVNSGTLMVDASTGYVGFGTLTPTQPLEAISQVSGFMAAFRAMFSGTSGAVLRVYKANGSLSAPRRITTINTTLGGINAFGYEAVDDATDATAGAVSGQFLFRNSEADYTSTTKGASFRLSVCPVGSATLGTTFDIYHDGTVLHFNVANIPSAAGAAPAGLVAGDLWVDTAAGNVLKRV